MFIPWWRETETNHTNAFITGKAVIFTEGELVEIWKGVDVTTDFGRITRLLMLLGSRRQEVGSLRWGELDLKKGIWRLPPERSMLDHPSTNTRG